MARGRGRAAAAAETPGRPPDAVRHFKKRQLPLRSGASFVLPGARGLEQGLSAALLRSIAAANPGVELAGWVLHGDNGAPMKRSTMVATMQ